MKNRNDVARTQAYRDMIGGLDSSVSSKTAIPVQGTPTLPSAASATLQASIDAASAAAQAEAAFHEAVAKKNAAIDAANVGSRTWP